MSCDIHLITEIRKDGKWKFVPERPESLNKGNYTTFAVLAGVRDSFNSCVFPAKGLPSDISGKKFYFESERPNMERMYNEDLTTCLVIGDEIVGELYSCDDSRYKKTLIDITELEYEQLKMKASDSWAYDSQYRELGWRESKGVRTYYVRDASVVGGKWEKVPFNKLFHSFDEFAQKKYIDEWNEEAQDYGYWGVDFDCPDFHTPSYITLKEFEDADYSDYTLIKYKIPKKFYQTFIDCGGVMPSKFKIEESSIGDLRDVFSEALSPTVTVGWQNDDVADKQYPVFEGIKELKEIAQKYEITNSEDIRIVFAFDN